MRQGLEQLLLREPVHYLIEYEGGLVWISFEDVGDLLNGKGRGSIQPELHSSDLLVSSSDRVCM